MREIKFRAWDIDTNKFYYWNARQECPKEVRSSGIIQQFTGLHDKNGKEVYEGDIVKLESMDGNYEILFKDAGFCANNKKDSMAIGGWYKNEKVEILGNIYETPELLTPTRE